MNNRSLRTTDHQDPREQQILEILKDGHPHKAGEIAFALGIHSRTVRRALHRMRDQQNLPIEANLKGFLLKDTSDPKPVSGRSGVTLSDRALLGRELSS